MKRTKKKYKLNDSPSFKCKKSLAKWAKTMISADDVSKGVVFTDGEISLWLNTEAQLYGFLEIE